MGLAHRRSLRPGTCPDPTRESCRPWRGPSDPPRRTHPLRLLHMPTCKKPPYADHAGVCVLGELLSLMLLGEVRPGEMAQARRVTTPRVFSTRPRDRDGLFWPGLVSGVWVVR